MVVEIRQLVNEINNFLEVLYKKDDLKNFSKFTVKQKKQSTGGDLARDVLKNFAELKINILTRASFLKKLQAGNLKLSEVATGDAL